MSTLVVPRTRVLLDITRPKWDYLLLPEERWTPLASLYRDPTYPIPINATTKIHPVPPWTTETPATLVGELLLWYYSCRQTPEPHQRGATMLFLQPFLQQHQKVSAGRYQPLVVMHNCYPCRIPHLKDHSESCLPPNHSER